MRSIRNLLWFAAAFLITAGGMFASYAHAATANGTYSGLDHINRIMGKTPGSSSVSGFSGGAFVTAAGDVLVKPGASAGVMKVPVSVKATVPASKIAVAALACLPPFSVIGAIGCAATAAAVVTELHDQGAFGVCAAGATGYFCKPEIGAGIYSVGGLTQTFSSAFAAASARATQICQQNGQPGGGYYCPVVQSCSETATSWICLTSGAYANISGGKTAGQPTGGMVAASDADVIAEMNRIAAADYQSNQRLLSAIRQDIAANPATFPPAANPIDQTTQLAVVAPPVMSPEVVTKVEHHPGADGSPSTKTTTEQTTVTPEVIGSTVDDLEIAFPSETTESVIDVDDDTGVFTRTDTTLTNPDAEPVDQTDFCIEFPERAGCAVFGEPPVAETVPNENIPVTYSPLSFNSPASCPAPIAFSMMGTAYAISYDPMCDFMSWMRPLFLAFGAIAAAYIFAEGFKS